LTLDRPVYVVVSRGSIWFFVMRDVIDLIFLEEIIVNHPWSIRDDLVDPTTMPRRFTPKFNM